MKALLAWCATAVARREAISDYSEHDFRAEEEAIPVSATGSVTEISVTVPRGRETAHSREGIVLSETPASGASSEYSQSPTTPWWFWWNILSLDAPTISVVWAILYTHTNGTGLSAAEAIVLALSVWIIYVSDRLLDGWTVRNRAMLKERHLFYARHRIAFASLVMFVVPAIAWVSTKYLTHTEVGAGLKLGVIVVLYMVGIHALRGRIARFVSKEVVVGVLFAAGTTLPMWSRGGGISRLAWMSLILFALLCSLNCLCIECWEKHASVDAFHEIPHLVRSANSRINLIAALLLCSALLFLLMPSTRGSSGPEFFAVSLGSLLFLFLDHRRNRFSRSALRVLADAVLLLAGLVALMVRI